MGNQMKTFIHHILQIFITKYRSFFLKQQQFIGYNSFNKTTGTDKSFVTQLIGK